MSDPAIPTLVQRLAALERANDPSGTPDRRDTLQVILVSQTAHGFTAGTVVRLGGGNTDPLWVPGSPTPGPGPGTGWFRALAGDYSHGLIGIVTNVLGPDRCRVAIEGIGRIRDLLPAVSLPNSDNAETRGWFLGATAGVLATFGRPADRVAFLLPDDRVQVVQPTAAAFRDPYTTSVHWDGDNSLWRSYPSLASVVDQAPRVGVPLPGGSAAANAHVGSLWTLGPTVGSSADLLSPEAIPPGTVGQALTMVAHPGIAGARLPAWTTITPAGIGAVPSTRTITAGTGLTGGGDLSADRTLALAATGVTPGTYGNSTAIPQLTVDAQGRVTAATTATISTAPDTVLGVSSNGYIRRTGSNTYTADASIPWSSLSGVPGSFTPSAHTHAASDITSGILATARGGFGTTVASAVGAVTGASDADLFVWWDKTNSQWTAFKFWNPSAVTGWVNCYDAAAADTNAKTTGVMAGTALSVFGRASNTDGLPAAMAAASDHQVMRRSGTALGFGAVNLAQGNAVTGALGVANGGIGATTATGAGRMPVSSAATTAAWSAVPTLGVAGSVLGSLTLESANATASSRLRVVVAGNEIALYYGGTAATDLVMRLRESDFAAIATSIKGTANCIQARALAECDSTGAAKSRVYVCSGQY